MSTAGIKYIQQKLNSVKTGLGKSGSDQLLIVDGIWGGKTKKAFDSLLDRIPNSNSLSSLFGPTMADTLCDVAISQLGITEEGGNNIGPEIVKFQEATWLEPGAWAWCAAFVDWCVMEAQSLTKKTDFERPQTAGAYDLENWAKTKAKSPTVILSKEGKIRKGDIIVFTFSHCGIAVDDEDAGYIRTVEGNTNDEGSREGDGVYSKLRKRSLVRSFIGIS